MTWTPWKKVADRLDWYTEASLRVPVCYQLALVDGAAVGDARPLEVVYAGAAASEHRELAAYAQGRRPLSPAIAAALTEGRELYYRARGAPSLEVARAELAALLAQGVPSWNRDGA